MRERFITVEPVEDDLGPERIDERLAQGWFPWCGQWMTCDAWPGDEGPRNTVWLRVRLQRRPKSDRWRRLLRDGCTMSWHPRTQQDDEHRELYEHFRANRHPDWSLDAGELMQSQAESPFAHHMREVAVRDAQGKLLAYRWFLEGATGIAGTTAVYRPELSGLGTIARTLADQWAAGSGYAWSYPGYVMPGARDPWHYKLKAGRSEWRDPESGEWRAWDGDAPQLDALPLHDMHRRLSALGEVVYNPGWALPCIRRESNGVAAPWFVFGAPRAERTTLVIWSRRHQRFQQVEVIMVESDHDREPGDAGAEDAALRDKAPTDAPPKAPPSGDAPRNGPRGAAE